MRDLKITKKWLENNWLEKIGTATDFGLAKKAKYQACVYVVTSFISCEINCKPQSGILVFEKLY